jgi:predicted amidohydrolase
MAEREIRVAAIALATVDGLMESNYARALRLAEIAAASSPDIILLPEAFAAGYCANTLTTYAEDKDSGHLQAFRRFSKDASCMAVLGYLEKMQGAIRNAAVIFDRGEETGRHYKRNLWPDKNRPYRDELSLLVPGEELEIFDTRLGRFSVIICYENMLEKNWKEVAGRVDFVLSPYNCEGDPAHNNITYGKKFGIPSAWADRTGTVWAGDHYTPNMGTAGLVDSKGDVIARSDAGVEHIVIGSISF